MVSTHGVSTANTSWPKPAACLGQDLVLLIPDVESPLQGLLNPLLFSLRTASPTLPFRPQGAVFMCTESRVSEGSAIEPAGSGGAQAFLFKSPS